MQKILLKKFKKKLEYIEGIGKRELRIKMKEWNKRKTEEEKEIKKREGWG